MEREQAIAMTAAVSAGSLGLALIGWALVLDWLRIAGSLVLAFAAALLVWNITCATIEWWWSR